MKSVINQIGLLVLPCATELDLTLHQEVFRVANGLLNEVKFCVDLLTVDDRDVQLTHGRTISPTAHINRRREFDLVIVLSHINPQPELLSCIHAAVRRLAKISRLMAAADQGPLLLAGAGVINGRVATCHVDLMQAARESFPGVEFVDRLWVRDGNFLTYPGHLSTVDTLLYYVSDLLGTEFGEALSVELIANSQRSAQSSQRGAKGHFEGVRDHRVLRAIDLMRSNIESPLSIPEIAEHVGVSTRCLEVLWRNELNSSPQLFYMRERVNHSCSLLLFSALSITEISCACGFNSGTSFSRAFSELTGLSPRGYRRQHGNKIAPAVLLNGRNGRRAPLLEGSSAGISARPSKPKLQNSD